MQDFIKQKKEELGEVLKKGITFSPQINNYLINKSVFDWLGNALLQANRHEVLVIASEQRSDLANGAVAGICAKCKHLNQYNTHYYKLDKDYGKYDCMNPLNQDIIKSILFTKLNNWGCINYEPK